MNEHAERNQSDHPELVREPDAQPRADQAGSEPHRSGGIAAPQREIADLRAAIEENGDDPELHFRLGLALDQADQPEQAQAAFADCRSRLDPTCVDAVKRMAQTLFERGRLEQAERFLELIADDSTDPELFECLLAIKNSQQRPLESLAILKKLADLRPTESKYCLWQVGIHLDHDQPAEALHAFERLPADERQQVDNQYFLGVIYFQLKEFGKAIEVLRGVVAGQPENSKAKQVLEHCEQLAAERPPAAVGKVSLLRANAADTDWERTPQRSVIRLRDVGLRYGRIRGISTREPAWSLRHLDLDIYEGETLGIVGRNGAGKTTLMRVLADLIKPDEGHIESDCGRRMMLSISMGFVPTISGRKNIMLTGLLLGESLATMRQKLDRIIAFSELASAIDDPVCTYSLGMRARLGFAIAFSAEPDVLLIDEVLGVGDQAFGRKSYEALRRRLEANKTAVLTTHNDIFIRNLCDRAVWLKDGRIQLVGEPNEVVDQYQASQTT